MRSANTASVVPGSPLVRPGFGWRGVEEGPDGFRAANRLPGSRTE
ncbi:hypothetical protein [Streptomyces chartreusis]